MNALQRDNNMRDGQKRDNTYNSKDFQGQTIPGEVDERLPVAQ